MSRLRTLSFPALAACGVLVLLAAPACEEDTKTAPARCSEPALQIYDIQAGAPSDGGSGNPCVTEVGHAINKFDDETVTGGTAGTGGSGGSAGKAGSGGKGGTGSADAGAGGA